MALTDTMLRGIKPTGKRPGDKHADGQGLYLLATPSGGRLWRFDYRINGKRRTLALGAYPAVTLARARKGRDAARELLADGVDPSEAKQVRKAASVAADSGTVQAVGLDWLATHRAGWSAAHFTREERNLKKDVFPYMGKRRIGDIEPPELLAVVRKVEARGALDVAHRVLITARGVWQHAIAHGHATRDVTQDIKKALKPHLRRNLPAIIEPQAFGELLRASDAYQGGPVMRAALVLAPLLFQRPGNLRTMRWADVDLDAALWAIPSEDMKRTKAQKINGQAHTVPLPRQALATLRELQPLTGAGEYVFPGFRDPTAPMSEAGISAALHAMGYKGRHSWHGYRASGRTMLREVLGFDVDVIETQLAHRGQVTHGGAYDRAQFIDARAVMLQAWADYLDKLRMGAQVIRLRG